MTSFNDADLLVLITGFVTRFLPLLIPIGLAIINWAARPRNLANSELDLWTALVFAGLNFDVWAMTVAISAQHGILVPESLIEPLDWNSWVIGLLIVHLILFFLCLNRISEDKYIHLRVGAAVFSLYFAAIIL